MIPFQVKNIMTASTGRTTVNTTMAWEDMQMPLNDIYNSIGSKLKLENNQITVQKDMKALVSLFFGCSASNFSNTELDYYIKINDTKLFTAYNRLTSGITSNSLHPTLITLKKGDKVSWGIIGGIVAEFTITYASLTIQEI